MFKRLIKKIKRIFHQLKLYFTEDQRKNQKSKILVGSGYNRPIQPIHSDVTVVNDETNVLDVDLIDKNTSEKNKKIIRQYSKKVITIILSAAIIWVTWNYVLATYALITYQASEPMVELSKEICTAIIATVVAYFAKAFLESFAEKTITPYLTNKDKEDNIQTNSDIDEAVG